MNFFSWQGWYHLKIILLVCLSLETVCVCTKLLLPSDMCPSVDNVIVWQMVNFGIQTHLHKHTQQTQSHSESNQRNSVLWLQWELWLGLFHLPPPGVCRQRCHSYLGRVELKTPGSLWEGRGNEVGCWSDVCRITHWGAKPKQRVRGCVLLPHVLITTCLCWEIEQCAIYTKAACQTLWSRFHLELLVWNTVDEGADLTRGTKSAPFLFFSAIMAPSSLFKDQTQASTVKPSQ